MLAYIAFTANNAREQELLLSPEIGSHVASYCKEIIANTMGLCYGGILAGHTYPFLTDVHKDEYTVAAFGERCWLAREKQHPIADDKAPLWRVILRPLQGRISPSRLVEFCDQLKAMECSRAVSKTSNVERAISVAPYNATSHPAWNTIATEDRRRDGAVVRIPSPGIYELRKDRLFAQCEDPQFTNPLPGSQHLQDLYYDDLALCAYRKTWEPAAQQNGPAPCPVLVGKESYMKSLPLFFQLPIFEVNPDFSIDCRSLEKFVNGASLRRP